MTETKTTGTDSSDTKKPKLSLSGVNKLELKRPTDTGQVRQSFSHGRSKNVQVEVRRKRNIGPETQPEPAAPEPAAKPAAAAEPETAAEETARHLTNSERDARIRALQESAKHEPEDRPLPPVRPQPVRRQSSESKPADAEVDAAQTTTPEESAKLSPEDLRQRELAELKHIEEQQAAEKAAEDARLDEESAKRRAEETRRRPESATSDRPASTTAPTDRRVAGSAEDDDDGRGGKRGKAGKGAKLTTTTRRTPATGDRRRTGKLTVTQALNDDDTNVRFPSLAAQRRAREKERLKAMMSQEATKVTRDVTVPDAITVQELANRMAERGGDVIKSLMRMGVMATINQTIDADTAQLVAEEFGHRVTRVSESDIEIGLFSTETKDDEGALLPRPPVVTVMGHVDHGKTSLLDALRRTDVAGGEAGGITQHIGAYQIKLENDQKISFIDTPGHAAFTEMRARGANVTDIVVLVVAADDGIMPQTIEAISHAKAAKVPIIVAINKTDLPDANPDKVRQELLSQELVVESLGGDVQDIEVSAKKGTNLDKLEEAILLQAEILELKANPNRAANGTVIEAKLDKGRGPVATVLVQGGTLKVGDVFVAGTEWGRVRALVNDRDQQVTEAAPAEPVEILGLQGVPSAGDEFGVVESEAKAREISEFRQRKVREALSLDGGRGSLEQMFSAIAAGTQKELAIVIKGDVHGSVEAIIGSFNKLSEETDEVSVRVLHSGVGAINESDVTLASSTGAMLVGFNVRANPQARDMAKRDGVDIRYYSIIYNLLDDVRGMVSGLLAPTLREHFLGNAEIREVFNITRVGKVAGCYVTEGEVKRGAKVRLLRDNVVIHEGSLKTLKRFKNEVREVKSGFECGMAFENYDDIQANDMIECFEVVEVARKLDA